MCGTPTSVRGAPVGLRRHAFMPGRQCGDPVVARGCPWGRTRRSRGTGIVRRQGYGISASAAECTSGAAGLGPGQGVRLQVNDAVVIGVPSVDDTGLLRLGVDEEIEVVPDQF